MLHTSPSTLKPHSVISSTFSNALSQTCSSSFGVDDIDDIGEEEITKRLPSSAWVEGYAGELRPIFVEERLKPWHRLQKSARGSHKRRRLTWMMSMRSTTEISPLATRNAGIVAGVNMIDIAWKRRSDRKGVHRGLYVYGLSLLTSLLFVL